MKHFFALVFLLYATTTIGQITFPAGFRLLKGSTALGEDDLYTNGRYFLQSHLLFRSYDEYSWNDEKFKLYVSGTFGYPFYRTKDSLLWGTGKIAKSYSYIVVDWGGEAFELFSEYSDAGFSYYSTWLLSSIRDYRRSGKRFVFPRRIPK